MYKNILNSYSYFYKSSLYLLFENLCLPKTCGKLIRPFYDKALLGAILSCGVTPKIIHYTFFFTWLFLLHVTPHDIFTSNKL